MSKRRRVVAVAGLLAGAVVAPASPVSAAVITVTTENDVVNAGDGVTSLREAMIEADGNGTADTIVLSPGASYQLTDCVSGPLIHDEGQHLTIDGNDATVAQTCTDARIFDKTGPSGATLTINDITMNGGPNSGVGVQGAAVRATSRLVLNGVTITGVDANFDGSVVQFGDEPIDFNLDVTDTIIDGNIGTAIRNMEGKSGVRLVDSTVTNHTGSGILLSDGDPIEVIGSTIAHNGGFGISTSGQGNGVQPELTITDSTLENNGFGGIDCATSCRRITMSGSQVIDNGLTAPPGLGGGIFAAFYGTGFPMTVAQVTIESSMITGNVADRRGGGLYIAASFQLDGELPSTTIENSTIADNSADCAECDGGGIAVRAGNLDIVGSNITGNSAGRHGGGVYLERSNFDNFDGETSFVMAGSTVSGNTAGDEGGGLYTHSSTQAISASSIHDNTAGGNGGGLAVGGNFAYGSGVATIDGTTIAGNTGAVWGGGLWVGFPDGSTANLTNSTVTANTADVAGGGLASSHFEHFEIDHVTVVGNISPQAANLGFTGNVSIDRSVIADPQGGGTNCDVLPIALPTPGVTTNGYSWASDASCALGIDDVVDAGADAQLGPPADNGGPTLTRLPSPTSPINSVVPIAVCSVAVDQRGVPRPIGSACEPGAVEVDDGPPNVIDGDNGKNLLVGTPAADVISGFAGNDRLFGLGGNDVLNGGPGRDVLSGGPGDDELNGGPGRDLLIAGTGVDVLNGGPGRDVLIAGDPQDVLNGGPGPDLCWSHASFLPTDC